MKLLLVSTKLLLVPISQRQRPKYPWNILIHPFPSHQFFLPFLHSFYPFPFPLLFSFLPSFIHFLFSSLSRIVEGFFFCVYKHNRIMVRLCIIAKGILIFILQLNNIRILLCSNFVVQQGCVISFVNWEKKWITKVYDVFTLPCTTKSYFHCVLFS